MIQPWKQVALDPNYSGAWVITGDIDGDGQVEIVSARNVNVGDVHYTSAVVAQRLDGQVLWRWGNPNIGRRGLHHDVACQICDWNGDGTKEVVVATKGYLVELDGATGKERRRLPIPPDATDCLLFANLSGHPRATDVLVKNRYGQIWALDYSGKAPLDCSEPRGLRDGTPAYPRRYRRGRAGRDHGWLRDAELGRAGPVDAGGRKKAWGAHGLLPHSPQGEDTAGLASCDYLLRTQATSCWRLTAMARPNGKSVAIILNPSTLAGFTRSGQGRRFLSILSIPMRFGSWTRTANFSGNSKAGYSRFHTLVDWNGDGYDEIVVPHERGVFDFRGRRIGTFAMEAQKDLYGGKPPVEGEVGHIVLRGDMDGDGVPDITITAPYRVYVFRNEKGRKPEGPTALGCGTNFTLY